MKIVYSLIVYLGFSISAFALPVCHSHCLVVETGYITSFELGMIYGGQAPGDSILLEDLGRVKGKTIEELKSSCEYLVEQKHIIYLGSESATIHLAQDYRLDTTQGQKVITGLTEKSTCP